ncbi:hypothetical protein EON65_00160 [archaeon]|nr:MAG: hypothetical protein EON65_00160 [archaeon]
MNIFPPLHEIGSNMLTNFQSWGDKRKQELIIENKLEDVRKLEERVGKFGEKFASLQQYKTLPVRRRISGHSNL